MAEDRPQIYLITPPVVDLGIFPDRLAQVLDRNEVACLRLALAGTDDYDLGRVADRYDGRPCHGGGAASCSHDLRPTENVVYASSHFPASDHHTPWGETRFLTKYSATAAKDMIMRSVGSMHKKFNTRLLGENAQKIRRRVRAGF